MKKYRRKKELVIVIVDLELMKTNNDLVLYEEK